VAFSLIGGSRRVTDLDARNGTGQGFVAPLCVLWRLVRFRYAVASAKRRENQIISFRRNMYLPNVQ